MKILIACEFSGKVRDAFIEKGHNAWSCDFLEAEGKYKDRHVQGNVLELLHHHRWDWCGYEKWDMLIAFPPCTYLCSSGLHWNKRVEGRQEKTEEALKFVGALLDADIPKIALENPVGCISTRIRKYDQMIHPYQFGDDASKRTCLWLKGLPKLENTNYFPPRIVKGGKYDGKQRWGNQLDSVHNYLAPSPTRAKVRSTTYDGIAKAMADQWGSLQTITVGG